MALGLYDVIVVADSESCFDLSLGFKMVLFVVMTPFVNGHLQNMYQMRAVMGW